MADIKLTYRNNSNDRGKSEIVIFQKPVGTDFDELAVAWKVIKHCGSGEYHPFTYPMAMQVACIDSDGNYSPQLDASNGDVFTMTEDDSGNVLSKSDDTCNSNEVEVCNDLDEGAMSAGIYKAKRLLALKNNISPGEKAVFQFKPSIWVGIASGVVEGDVMNSAVLSQTNMEFSLLGIASADIVLTGGNNERYRFRLENVVKS